MLVLWFMKNPDESLQSFDQQGNADERKWRLTSIVHTKQLRLLIL